MSDAPEAGAGPASPAPDDLTGTTSTGVDPRLSVLLCYLGWWVSGLIFLVLEQQHRTVRFHAAQSLVLFGGLSLVMMLISVASFSMLFVSPAAFQMVWMLSYVVWFTAVILWMIVMMKTLKGESWRVPVAGDLAARIASR